ncbi:nucleoside hydrolase [Streptomyces thinghirensis]|nr:nucleoside hydrolase [Streptomyces thinghirensis]
MTANHPRPRVLVLDTDIGSDVDDALALGVLPGSPEADLAGITTVYGDTLLRARLAHRLAALAGHAPDRRPGRCRDLVGQGGVVAGPRGHLLRRPAHRAGPRRPERRRLPRRNRPGPARRGRRGGHRAARELWHRPSNDTMTSPRPSAPCT